MSPMLARRLVFSLLLYVSLDFANPLMPGAVQFLNGSFSVVSADRVRPESPSVDAALLHHPAPGPTALVPALVPHPRPLIRERRPRLVIAHRPKHAPPDPAPSPEDH
jgi:hypothetical protein